MVIPGINDAHYHLSFAPEGSRLHFVGQEPTWKEVRDKLTDAVSRTPKGTLIFGETGAALFEAAQANRDSLDKLAPDHPVVLQGWTGHYYVLNTLAIQKLGQKENEPDPLGGRFVRSSDGKLTGVTLEYATFRLHRVFHTLVSEQDALEGTRNFLNEAARLGITSVQNMSMPIAPERFVSLLEKAPARIHMRIMRFLLTDERRRITEEGRELPR